MKAIHLSFQEFKHLEWQGSLFWLQNEKTIFPLAEEAGKLQLKSIPAKLFTIPNKNNQIGHQWSPYLKITFWYKTMVKDITRRYLLDSHGSDDHYRMAVLAFQVFYDREKEFLGILKSGFNAIIRDDTSVKNLMVLFYDSILECCTVFIPSNASKFHIQLEKDIVAKITETNTSLRVWEELEAILHKDNNILKQYLVKSFLCVIRNIDEKIKEDMLNLKKRACE